MNTQNKTLDAIIVGGGHNGLVCAAMLAARGWRVRVLERRPILGGAAVTEEFHPGFRNSTASYTVSLLHPEVIRDLHLIDHGLRVVERPLANFLPLGEHGYLKMGGGLAATQAEVAKFSERDAARLPDYYAMLGRAVTLVRAMLTETPPNVGERGFAHWRDVGTAFSLALRARNYDLAGKRDLLDLFTKSAGEILDYWFESVPLKAALGFDSVVGHYASPYEPGSAYVFLHHAFGEVNGKAIGGMGAISDAIAREAQARGAELSVNCPVERVIVRDGRAHGVVLGDGSEIAARIVVSNVHPKILYERLVERDALPQDFSERIARYRSGSGTLRMNVALSELPDFSVLPGKELMVHHQSGIIMAPSLAYMDRAWLDARRHGFSREPIVEMLIPSTVDDSLAPPGAHVASLFCQHFSPQLDPAMFPNGWDDAREAAADAAIAVVNQHAPNFAASIIARQIHTPLDLERKFGLIGGDIFHGALTMDQLFSARPVLGHADYRSPIAGLYHCGAGAHPGGGVTGLPGRNAAREILRDG
jgi:phytoene dehydrogenase-like protein